MCDTEIQAEIEDSVLLYTKASTSSDECAVSVIGVLATSSGQMLSHVLRHTAEAGMRHFVVVPCDIITNLPPQVLVEAYRSRADSAMGLLVGYHNTLDLDDKKHRVAAKNYSVYTKTSTGDLQMLDYYSADDVAFHKALSLRTQLVWRYPNASVSTRVLNALVFFGDAYAVGATLAAAPEKFSDAYFSSRPLIKVVRDLARRLWQSSHKESTVALMLVPDQAAFLRAHTLPEYVEANRHYLKLQARENAGKPPAPKEKMAATVGVDALVGSTSVLGERTNVKRSVVGANCTIGRRVRLTGAVVMDNVTIEDDVQLENTVVGHGAVVGARSKLTNCFVEATNTVAQGTASKGDTLLCLTLEGLVESELALESSDDGLDESSDYDEGEYEGEYDNSDGLFGY